jgi:frataxin-like iron-binding protein CyaY
MKSLSQYIQSLRNAQNEISSSRLALMNTLAADTLATVQERVQEKGISSQNVSYSKYSSDYEKWRIKNGFQAEHKDFTKTGRMWQNTQIVVKSHSQSRTVVLIAPTQRFEIKKMQWNSAREGSNLLKLTRQEESVLQSDYKNAILKIIKKHI